jgi:hypothetical protein
MILQAILTFLQNAATKGYPTTFMATEQFILAPCIRVQFLLFYFSDDLKFSVPTMQMFFDTTKFLTNYYT